MPSKKPNIVYLKGRSANIHLEAPHATQASAAEFDQIISQIVKTDAKLKRGKVLVNHFGLILLWHSNDAMIEKAGLSFNRCSDEAVFTCNAKDKGRVIEVIRPYLEATYDYGTMNLTVDLNDELNIPVLIDGQHRYVGGDLNRPLGFVNPFYIGSDNSEKWAHWNSKELDIIKRSRNGAHVAISIHSMDKRPYRRFKNEKTGKYEFDREIIIGTRFGATVDPRILESFFFALEDALKTEFKNGKVPRMKIDLEFIGNKVLKDRRQAHKEKGDDVHYIQIEFMKYLLKGKNYNKILSALKYAIERLDHQLLQNSLEIPRTRELYNAEYTDWREKIDAKEWKYKVEIESLHADMEPYVRLSSAQREYLHVELLDYVEDSEGGKWLVKNQFLDKARPYTEKDKITVYGGDVVNLVLIRK